MQSGSGTVGDLFAGYEQHHPATVTLPPGSRLAQYLGGGAQVAPRPPAWNNRMILYFLKF